MNIALILAGGSGKRTGQAVPKQFLTVFDIPIIIYTMRNMQKCNCLDEIYVVAPEGWEQFLSAYAMQFGVDKYHGMAIGGETRVLSIYNGLKFLCQNHQKDDVVVLTDANRPLISERIYQDSILGLKYFDCTVALSPCHDSMFVSQDGVKITEIADRSTLFCAQTPESALLGQMVEVYEWAIREQRPEQPVSALFHQYGKSVMGYKGSSKSFKITTLDDIEIFKAIIKCEGESTQYLPIEK